MAGCLPWAPPRPQFPQSPPHSLGFPAWHCPVIPSRGAVDPLLCPLTTYLYAEPQTPPPPHPGYPGGPLHPPCTRPLPGPRPVLRGLRKAKLVKTAALALFLFFAVSVPLPSEVSRVTAQSSLTTDHTPGLL